MGNVKFVTPKIALLAWSEPQYLSYDQEPAWRGDSWPVAEELYARAGADYPDCMAEDTMEFAGRTCYKAYGRKNPKTAKTEDYLANIIAQKHGSVLEHSSFTFLFRNVSRAATHEIVRHRHFSFSQESQRYVTYEEELPVVAPPLVTALSGVGGPLPELSALEAAHEAYTDTFLKLKDMGYKRKEAAEAARMYLPNCTATAIVVTGNARSWLEFISKRDHPAADQEIQHIAREVARLLEQVIPSVMSQRDVWGEESSQHAPK